MSSARPHPFEQRPRRTLLALAVPVLLSLIAEPVTGMVDTAFVASLGTVPLAGLGVGTIALSSIFWIFNFLGIGTQTEVALAYGAGRKDQARERSYLAFFLAAAFGVVLCLAAFFVLTPAARALGAEGEVLQAAREYMGIRLMGAPAVLMIMAGFGTLRGLQCMQIPLVIAVALNLLNILLDRLLIFGWGPVPAFGIAGAAWASTFSQWFGAGLSFWAVGRQLGAPMLRFRGAPALLRVGGDLFLRTGLLSLFLLFATRVANQIDPGAGAAHQSIRQVWFFTALVLDAFAASAQSLVGYFLGANRFAVAKQVAALACRWSLATGFVLTAVMLLGEPLFLPWFVPEEARPWFHGAWVWAALSQPLNSLSFVTDGIHWGTRDFAYLRKVMTLATICGIGLLLLIPTGHPQAYAWVWAVTGAWIFLRALFGMLRIWPGIGRSPWRDADGLGSHEG
ncbi:MAG: MATE family efflux transporter [Planctomycetota bacterium]|nr:MAG: MATE family efflux transporter [Planctomycetota bacterium]